MSFGYFGVMALIVVPVAAFAAAAVTPPRRRSLRDAGAATLVALAATAAFAIAALPGGGDGGIGAVRKVADLDTFGLRPIELVVPSPGNPLLSRFAPGFFESRKHGSNIQEISNYLGWITLGLAAVWLVVVVRRRRSTSLAVRARAVTAACSAVALTAFLFALPGSVHLVGAHWEWMPSRLLFEAVRPFRVPSRWTPVIVLAVVILAALGLQAVLDRVTSRLAPRPARLAVVAIVAVAAAGSFVELRATHPGVHYRADGTPPEYALLAGTTGGALAEYPFVLPPDTINATYALWQRRHGRPLVNGASQGMGVRARDADAEEVEDVRRSVIDPAAPGAAGRLAALGVTAVITRPNTYGPALEIELPDRPPALGHGFLRVGSVGGGTTVWRVTARPAPAIAYLESPAFAAPTVGPNGTVAQEMHGARGAIVLTTGKATRATLRMRLYARGAGSRSVTVGSVSARIEAAGTDVAVPVELARGRTRLPITVLGAGHDDVPLLALPPELLPATRART
jgi:hypothetical protein